MLHELITSKPAREFLSAFIFWDEKRPITAHLLSMLDLAALARVLGKENDVTRKLAEQQIVEYTEGARQQLLFREDVAEYSSNVVANEQEMPTAQQRHAADGAPHRR